MNAIKVSPSSFGFLYDECKTCFYAHVHGLWRRPRAPFPTIFTTIDLSMKRHFATSQSNAISGLDLRFRIERQAKWVRSDHLPSSDGGLPLTITGTYDSLLMLEDGSRAICDFKTSPVNRELVDKYARQLHAYAWAMERPQLGPSVRVDRLGLAVFEPQSFNLEDGVAASLSGSFTWIEIRRDDCFFRAFLDEVSSLLSLPTPPTPCSTCAYCKYREAA
jgi:hypothetical protein